MLKFIINNQIASAVAAGLIISFILWLIIQIKNRIKIWNASLKSDDTNTDIGVDQKSFEEKSFNLTQLQNSILLQFSEIGTELRIRHLMKVHEIDKTEAGFHVDTLIKYDLLHLGGHSGDGSYHYVTQNGREYLMKIRRRRKR